MENNAMSSGPVGAELSELLDLRASLLSCEENLREVETRLNAQIASTWWKGGAADRFRSAWEDEHRMALIRLRQLLEESSDEIQGRHDAIASATN
jgi:uncharacterized protein YukE